jgi:hypothetical protein
MTEGPSDGPGASRTFRAIIGFLPDVADPADAISSSENGLKVFLDDVGDDEGEAEAEEAEEAEAEEAAGPSVNPGNCVRRMVPRVVYECTNNFYTLSSHVSNTIARIEKMAPSVFIRVMRSLKIHTPIVVTRRELNTFHKRFATAIPSNDIAW